jgi:hypothetical protein
MQEVTTVEEEEPLSKEVVTNMLIAMAINTCNSSYDKTHQRVRDFFYGQHPRDILCAWEWLNDQSKVKVITAKKRFFDSMVKEFLENDTE